MKTDTARRVWHRWVALFLLAMVVAHAVVFWQQRNLIAAGYGDFSAFYTAGLMVRKGMTHQLYDPQAQWKMQQEFASQVAIRKGPMPFVRPPFEAVVFLPFTYFTYPVALALWSLLKLGALWLALRILPREAPFTPIYPPRVEAVLSFGFFPVFLDFYQGQDAVLLLFLVVLAFRHLLLRRDVAAGAVLALGLFKFHLILPVVIVLCLVRRPRVLVGFLPVAAVLVVVSLAIAGPGALWAYPAYLLQLNRAGGVGMVTAQSMTNLRGLLTAWVGRAAYPGPIHWALLPLAIAALWYTVRLWRSRDRAGLRTITLGFSLALVVTILTSYYAYSYDITLLLVPALFLGGGYLERAELGVMARVLIVTGLLALICAPLYWALILRFDRPYLMVIPISLLAMGIGGALRDPVQRVNLAD